MFEVSHVVTILHGFKSATMMFGLAVAIANDYSGFSEASRIKIDRAGMNVDPESLDVDPESLNEYPGVIVVDCAAIAFCTQNKNSCNENKRKLHGFHVVFHDILSILTNIRHVLMHR